MRDNHDEQRNGDALGAQQSGQPEVQQSVQSVNYGISGAGTINAGNLAVGPHSRIEVSVEGSLLAPQLDALAQAIAAFDGPHEKRAEMTAVQCEIGDQLGSSSPDKRKLLSKLATIASAAGSASAIASAAEALAGVIQHVL